MAPLVGLLIELSSNISLIWLGRRRGDLVVELSRLVGAGIALLERLDKPVTNSEIQAWKQDALRRAQTLSENNGTT